MDREIPIEEIKRKRNRRLLIGGGVVVALFAGLFLVLSLLSPSVKESQISIGTADKGTIETSADASGKVVPAYEITLVSPVATKILEIHCHEGDLVEEGQSLMKLDLLSEESELRRVTDQKTMKVYESRRADLDSRTTLTNLEMQIKAKEMSVARLRTEVSNERHLDSIGSGTGDRVKEAELAYRTAALELDQMRKQLANERLSHEAARKGRTVEEGIYSRNIEEMQRTLNDAGLHAPMKATVSYLNSSLGTSISAGEKLAVLSDLNHFKVTAEIAEGSSDKVAVGSEVKVRIGKNIYPGKVASVSPQSQNGVVSFTVLLDNDSDAALRSGIRAEVNVVYDILENVVRIPNGAYYKGPGSYRLFVETDKNVMERRDVVLGESNFQYVEVKSGIRPGERFIMSESDKLNSRKKVKIEK